MWFLFLTMLVLTACRTPTQAPAPAKSDATMASQLRASIVTVYGESRPSWYVYLGGGTPDVAVRDGVGIVATSLAPGDEGIARIICRAIAAVVFDANGDAIGISDLIVIGAGESLATCDTGT